MADPIQPAKSETKSVLQSLTVWVNVLGTVVNSLAQSGVLAVIPQPYGWYVQIGLTTLLRLFRPNETLTVAGVPLSRPSQ